MTLKFNRVCQGTVMFMPNFIKLSAAVHVLSCPQAFLPYIAMVKNPIIRSCNLDVWP